ncbi:MAG: TIGR01906 family membrane protein [Longicatena sp.]
MKQNILDRLNSILAYVAVISLMITLLVTSISVNCFNRDFFASEYATLETAKDLGMTDKDLNGATNTLLDYLQDKRSTIKTTITLKGMEQDAFNSREASHMVDVKGLYQFVLVLRNVCVILFVGSIIYLIVRLKQGALTLFSINYMKMAAIVGVFFTMLAIWAYADFDSFWTAFHKLMFRNDLWLLNPDTDLMINLFPSQFFSSLVFRVVGMFASAFIIVFFASYLYLRKRLKKMNEAILNDD